MTQEPPDPPARWSGCAAATAAAIAAWIYMMLASALGWWPFG